MKKITHYFINSGYGTQPKNNLQKEFSEYLIGLNGLLIDESEFIILTDQIRKKAQELNEKHKRCKALTVKFWETYQKQFALERNEFVIFRIKPATFKKLGK